MVVLSLSEFFIQRSYWLPFRSCVSNEVSGDRAVDIFATCIALRSNFCFYDPVLSHPNRKFMRDPDDW